MLHIHLSDTEIKYLGTRTSKLPSILISRSFLARVGQLLAAQGKANLDEGSADGVSSYKLLLPSTLRSKIKTFTPSSGKNKGVSRIVSGSYQPLIRSGALKRSIHYEASAGQLYLTAVKYAIHHQYGAPKRNLPARPIFYIRSINRADIFDLIKSSISSLFKK